jgi:hypothetical protein
VAPALETAIRAEGLDRRRAKAIAAKSREADGLPLDANVRRFRRGASLAIPAVRGILRDEADPDAVTWAMEPDGLERLAATLEWLFERLPGELVFEALSGAEPGEQVVTRAELLRIVRAGRIGTRTRYHVLAP